MSIDLLHNEYMKDLLFQPTALADTFAYLDREGQEIAAGLNFRNDSYKRIVLTGMGSSYHALAPLYYRLITAGITTHWIETSELIYYADRYLEPDTLLVVVSQSGSSAEVSHLLKTVGRQVKVFAVVNDPESELAHKATWKVLTKAGKEFSVSCKTYLSTLMALNWLGDILLPQTEAHFPPLKECIPWVAGYLKDWQEHVEELKKLYQGKTDLFLIGRGDSLAAVGTGGLILKESAHFHSEGMSSAAFRHGPKEMLSQSVQVVVFEGPEKTQRLNHQMAEELQGQGFNVEMIAENSRINAFRLPKVPESCRPLVEMLPVEMSSLALALLNDHEPGVFSIGSKVTDIE
jgi:glucosamine--fructose-6-phosphate aminotransferase (isomerizing)